MTELSPPYFLLSMMICQTRTDSGCYAVLTFKNKTSGHSQWPPASLKTVAMCLRNMPAFAVCYFRGISDCLCAPVVVCSSAVLSVGAVLGLVNLLCEAVNNIRF